MLLSEVIHQREQENIFSAKSKGGKDKKRSLVKRKQQSEEAKPELQFMTASEVYTYVPILNRIEIFYYRLLWN